MAHLRVQQKNLQRAVRKQTMRPAARQADSSRSSSLCLFGSEHFSESYDFVRVHCVISRVFPAQCAESGPIHTVRRAGSTANLFWSFQNAKVSGPSSNVTSFFSPGAREIR